MKLNLSQSSQRGKTQSVFIILPRFNMSTLVTMIETMRIANYLLPEPEFSWQVSSFDGSSLTASNGMEIAVDSGADGIGHADLVFVLGSWGTEHYDNRDLLSWLRTRARQGGQICAVELGCYVVARAGLLDGKSATTHWSWLNGFRESFDAVNVSERLFTIDNRVMTCAGGLAGIDLMLQLIESNHGSGLAGEIADQMLHHPVRPGNTSQRETMGQGTEALPPVVRRAIELIERNLEEPPTVPQVADALGLSQRQLERRFKKNIGCTVVQFSLLLRLQNARVLLISTDLGVREIAAASGFNTMSHFAYSFGKIFGRKPSEYREAWPIDDEVPSWPGTLSEFLANLQIYRGKS